MLSTPPSVVMLIEDNRIDRRALDAARSLVKAGWHATVIAGSPPSPGYRDDENSYPEVEIVRIDPERTNALVRTFEFDRLCKTIEGFPNINYQDLFHCFTHHLVEAAARKADVYVAHDLPQLPAAAIVASFHNAGLLYDSHELFTEQNQGEPQRTLLTLIEQMYAPLADVVMTINRSIALEMTRRLAIDIPEVVINAPDLDPTSIPVAKTDRLRKALNIPPDKKILLYQGHLGRVTRNIEALARAVPLLTRSDVAVVFLGADYGVKEDILEVGRQSQTLGRSLFIHDPVTQSELLSYTASADVGIIPYQALDMNMKFCTPNKLFEFITAGVPVLAQNLIEISRIVDGDKIGRTADLSTPTSIAKAIDSFFAEDHTPYRDNIHKVAERYTWGHQAQRVVAAYERARNRERLGAVSHITSALGALRRCDADGAQKSLLKALLALNELS